jgi:hypothetical protein
MAHSRETRIRDRMRVQFAEADFEIGFNLVDMAEEEAIRGNYARASRILKDADSVFLDIQQILRRLTIPDRDPFAPLLGELDRAIGLAKLHIAGTQM